MCIRDRHNTVQERMTVMTHCQKRREPQAEEKQKER